MFCEFFDVLGQNSLNISYIYLKKITKEMFLWKNSIKAAVCRNGSLCLKQTKNKNFAKER